jgi:predicted phosphodiesterase
VLTAVVSDLHLGARMSVVRTPQARSRLLEIVSSVEQVVLLGDVLSLRERRTADVFEAVRPFLDRLADSARGRRVVIVPGNHDHRLAEAMFERRSLEPSPRPLGLQEIVEPGGDGLAGALARRLPGVDLVIAYPGFWITRDVYATHGHYLDCHMTVPRREAVCAAVVAALRGGVPDPATPDDYEAVVAPLYSFAHAYAQSLSTHAIRGARFWRAAQHHIWRHVLGGTDGVPIATRITGGIVAAGALHALNSAGLGPFTTKLSPGAIADAGVAAATEMIRRLRIDATHVVFGHTHRAGPLAGEAKWELADGPSLMNPGSWVFESGLIGEAGSEDPYWPGRCVLVREAAVPEICSLLDDSAPNLTPR